MDALHPDAVRYIKGYDPLEDYEAVLAYCKESGKYSARAIIKQFGYGRGRTKIVLDKILEESAPPTTATKKSKPVDEETESIGKPNGKVIRGQELAKDRRKREAVAAIPDEVVGFEIPESIERFADMTLRELILRFGTDSAFCDWLAATQRIEMIEEKRLKNAVAQGKLINRELVKKYVVETFDEAHMKLLSDGAKTIAVEVPVMHDAEFSRQHIEKWVSEQITSFIRPVKAKVERALKNA